VVVVVVMVRFDAVSVQVMQVHEKATTAIGISASYILCPSPLRPSPSFFFPLHFSIPTSPATFSVPLRMPREGGKGHQGRGDTKEGYQGRKDFKGGRMPRMGIKKEVIRLEAMCGGRTEGCKKRAGGRV
jgi:hypothetical protein